MQVVIAVSAGRSVVLHEHAAGDGPTVVLCHPAPGSGAFDPGPAATWSRGVTLLAADRPGYGRSDPMPDGEWATVASAAADLRHVLAERGETQVGVVGWGEGGWPALALAAHHPELVNRLVLIGTPAPDEELPYLPASTRELVARLHGARAAEAQAAFSAHFSGWAAADPFADDALECLHVSAGDDEVLRRPGAREQLADMLTAAFAQDTTGLAADLAGSMLQPWGFRPADVKAKTLLLFGQRDPFAPARHARWWLNHLPQARVETSPSAGHLLILGLWERALSHLAPRSRRS